MIESWLPYFLWMLPLAAAGAVALRSVVAGEVHESSARQRQVALIVVTAMGAAFALALVALASVIEGGPWYTASLPWLTIGTVEIRFGLVVDQLSAVMLVLVSGVSLIVHLFARRYMQEEPGYSRFYALLSGITGVTLLLVMATDLVQLLLLWQLIGFLLYLLLGFDLTSKRAADSANWSLLINRAGDAAFALGALVLITSYGTSDLATLFEQAASAPAALGLGLIGLPDTHLDANTVGVLLIFGGAMAKSAQFPLHVWLPNTMDAPTPVSALMHAGLVNAGGFLLNRLAPLYVQSDLAMHAVFTIGTLTALLGSTIMLTQTDVKRALGYSTVGQMGYMMMECGLGAFALAIFHLAAHGIFKATLFLNAGNLIHATRRNPNTEPDPDTGPQPRLPLWVGLGTTLALPLLILIGVHELLGISIPQHQGAIVLLFFGWVTASQAALSVYRAGARDSLTTTVLMLTTLFVVVFGYMAGGHAFESFLYPEGSAARVEIEIDWLAFSVAIALATVLIVLGWIAAFRRQEVEEGISRAGLPYDQGYVLVRGGLYIEGLYQRWIVRPAHALADLVDRRL